MNPGIIGTLLFSAYALFQFPFSHAQENRVTVDRNGIMRWTETGEEVRLFGVNYTLPFAHAFRAHKYIGVDYRDAIDADVYHFARLGLDAFRCHIWDSEISDSVGNIISNEHLDALDYLLYRLEGRGISSILTPLKFGRNGYPEPDTPTPGFSDIYGKNECLNNPDTWPCQVRYLVQFLEHVNPYTGLSYKDDPGIVAIEINNEPEHTNAGLTRDYLETMIEAIRSTGFSKPVFYNMSHNFQLTGEFLNADLQGGSFQWYPTGLVANHEQKGNFLPNVDVYPIPFSDRKTFGNKARMIYEFDAADIGRSYIYPAMARSFRESGFQFAAQFAYDPVYLAYANTEYQTHYMNLAYAPQKALSLMIASEAFHRLPLYGNYGRYPENLEFDGFRVSYRKDLAEMLTKDAFLYTNNTSTVPPEPENLERIAGFGNSPVVKYEGGGAYFLDRLEEGIWRLEVMPDAIWVRDPFEKASLKKTVSVIKWKKWSMSINLPGLGSDFGICGINAGNTLETTSRGKEFQIGPGTYLLARKGKSCFRTGEEKWKNIELREFFAPGPSGNDLYLLHHPVREYSLGQAVRLQVGIISQERPEKVEISYTLPDRTPCSTDMEPAGGYVFETTLPDTLQQTGYLEYHISVLRDGKWCSWPSMWKGRPGDWDFFAERSYKVRVVRNEAPIRLFSPAEDFGWINRQYWKANYALDVEQCSSMDAITFRGAGPEADDNGFRLYVGDRIRGRISDLSGMKRIVISGKSLTNNPCPVRLAVVTDEGAAYGSWVQLVPEKEEYSIAFDRLEAVPLILAPEGFPAFLPRSYQIQGHGTLAINRIEAIQLTIGSTGSSPGGESAVSVTGIRLEK